MEQPPTPAHPELLLEIERFCADRGMWVTRFPALALAGAPRFHSGGGFGLRSDEQAAILLRGERVLNRAQTRAWENGAGAQVNIYARDVQSFRQSRTQVAADIARAVSAGRRGM